MAQVTAAIVFAILAWWISTGLVMAAARRPLGRGGLAAATVVGLAGLAGLYLSARMESALGVYAGFLSALAVWAWHELTFLLGLIAGPRRAPCPAGLAPWPRFRGAFAAVRDHELALFVTALLVVALTWGGANPVGVLTFLILWVMRISAKLTVFSGAPHSINAMIPERLRYLTSYFRTDRVSPFFPLCIGAALAAFFGLAYAAIVASTPHATAGCAMLAAFMALAIIEHLFLISPVPDWKLWSWAMRGAPRQDERPPPTEADITQRQAKAA